MFLIDKPFVSDFLIQTLKENKHQVVATKEAKELISNNTINWISEKNAIDKLKRNPKETVYTNSENALSWVIKNIPDSKLASQIQLFKDKTTFREVLKNSFPNFQFKTIRLEEIKELTIEKGFSPFVIKPSVGFFSIGVHIVKTLDDWEVAKSELNYENLKSIYPKEVLDATTFIIEEFIEGEEYAVDCYFNDKGEIVVLNILHHIFSSGTDVSDRVYSTSKEILMRYKKDIEHFLQKLGTENTITNFPMHVELRIDENGFICPIEINPMRFGGWCTTGDLTYHAYGINSYNYFINQQKPNWEQIFKEKGTKKYSIVILNNNSGFKDDEISNFDYDLLISDFENVVELRKLDIKTQPVFGFLFTETSPENEEELTQILTSDLRKYIQTEK